MRIEGREKLRRALTRWPGELRRAVRPELRKNAEELVAAQRSLAPEDTGELIDGITRRPYARDKALGELVSSAAFYGLFWEFGTDRLPAQPFFFPPYRALRRRFRGRIARAITRGSKRLRGLS